MAQFSISSMAHEGLLRLQQTPPQTLLAFAVLAVIYLAASLYVLLYFVAPVPRPARQSEKTYKTILPDGQISEARQLPCWIDDWRARKEASQDSKQSTQADVQVADADVFMSVVVPAYNEEARMTGMLEEAVEFLQAQYGDAHGADTEKKKPSTSSEERKANGHALASNGRPKKAPAGRGWEILIVSDGSTDKTVDTALTFAKDHQLSQYPPRSPGPWSPNPGAPTHIPHGSIRVVALEKNRGKGGAVTHGMRHVRGEYVIFADADGASRFEDLAGLVMACGKVEDSQGRGIAIGSRAHLVGSEAVVKRSFLRNTLMRGFHLFIRLLTPHQTSRIKDTQCGFKLFSRASLPYIIPYMHMEGWIFDVEMLMLAESAGIPMFEVPIGWKEVSGSKLNVIKDSIGMAWGLAVLRAAWFLGVYRRS